jgi:hypothetical protein
MKIRVRPAHALAAAWTFGCYAASQHEQAGPFATFWALGVSTGVFVWAVVRLMHSGNRPVWDFTLGERPDPQGGSLSDPEGGAR